jgi:hypothetical protein
VVSVRAFSRSMGTSAQRTKQTLKRENKKLTAYRTYMPGPLSLAFVWVVDDYEIS